MHTLHQIMHLFWPHFIGAAGVLITLATALHVIFHKHNIRAAIGWLGLIWFLPFFGAVLYFFFGINRIQKLAKSKLATKEFVPLPPYKTEVRSEYIKKLFADIDSGLPMLAELTGRISRQPLVEGNSVQPLLNGDQVFPAMIAAIENAQESISLCSYIFDNDPWGNRVRIALTAAMNRGVEVRALIDAIGLRYSFPSIIRKLRRDGIKVARFLGPRSFWPLRYMNLRNHRKIMVVDGRIGFTGGINIRAGSFLADKPAHPVQDIHFRLQGPIVAELQHTFVEDWTFTTGEKLEGERWFPELDRSGDGIARGISDGPDEDFGRLRLVILGALTMARKSIRIATPYFLPDDELVAGLKIAALRGVDVEILLPGVTNLRMIKWASDAGLEELLEHGCRIYYAAPPFDHSKLMLVDNSWVLIGSANWDPRSLTLNFEFNVECYDIKLATEIDLLLDKKLLGARELSFGEFESRFIGVRLRNRLLRLFSPYL